MAENVLETRILLRYGTYSEWMSSEVILKQGEAAIAIFPYQRTIVSSDSFPDKTPPAVGIKIGDGYHYFSQLPWVQAIAADVYSWAKDSNKPSYTAQEIEGLRSYVENLIQGDVPVTIAPRIYTLTRGTGANVNKYYLQYKENNESGDWIIDTSNYIDLSDLVKIFNWIGSYDLNEYISLGDRTEDHIQNDLARLRVTDNEVEGYFVTAVSQTNGRISVTKQTISFADISGTLPVSKGGTGLTSLTEDTVLASNGTDGIKLIPIAETIASNNDLVPNYLIKEYVDNATAGLTGAMHFIGEANVVITPNSSVDPRIPGYSFNQAQYGDVILYESKEYVWAGQWHLLGDEGSYAVKGSITDIDIDENAEIQQSKIAGLDISLNEKVDKVEGKTLTSNDFTDEFKTKLENIEDSAEQNVIEHIYVNNTEVRPKTIEENDRSVNLEIKEFSDEAEQKLNNIAAGAEVNKIDTIIYDGETLVPNGKTITITSNPHREHENKVESLIINETTYYPDENKQINITIDQAALNLNVLEGAQVPNGNQTEEVTQINKKLQLERIAVTGDVTDLKQTNDTYIIFDCGSSTDVI